MDVAIVIMTVPTPVLVVGSLLGVNGSSARCVSVDFVETKAEDVDVPVEVVEEEEKEG